MQMNTLLTSLAEEMAEEHAVTHDEIARRAQVLWRYQGRPLNRDLDIWLEAESELQAIKQKVYRHPHLNLT
jgi:hypothetical protein